MHLKKIHLKWDCWIVPCNCLHCLQIERGKLSSASIAWNNSGTSMGWKSVHEAAGRHMLLQKWLVLCGAMGFPLKCSTTVGFTLFFWSLSWERKSVFQRNMLCSICNYKMLISLLINHCESLHILPLNRKDFIFLSYGCWDYISSQCLQATPRRTDCIHKNLISFIYK